MFPFSIYLINGEARRTLYCTDGAATTINAVAARFFISLMCSSDRPTICVNVQMWCVQNIFSIQTKMTLWMFVKNILCIFSQSEFVGRLCVCAVCACLMSQILWTKAHECTLTFNHLFDGGKLIDGLQESKCELKFIAFMRVWCVALYISLCFFLCCVINGSLNMQSIEQALAWQCAGGVHSFTNCVLSSVRMHYTRHFSLQNNQRTTQQHFDH